MNVAAVLERHRSALVDAIVAPIDGASVGDEMLATYLVDGLARRVRGQAPLAPAPVLVSAADVPGRLAAALLEQVGGFAPAPPALAEAVRGLLRELPWSTAHGPGNDPPGIAECGGALAEYLARLELADPAGAEHARAVAAWCRRIAERLGLGPASAAHAAGAGLVHDAGEAALPRAIPSAPRRPDAYERLALEFHVSFGETIVRAQPGLRRFAAAVRSHHERWDGRGYPDGLAGQRIPLSGRIVAVADAFNAMIDRRPYRAPRPPAAALLELERERGRQFDPAAVDAMIAVVEDRP